MLLGLKFKEKKSHLNVGFIQGHTDLRSRKENAFVFLHSALFTS